MTQKLISFIRRDFFFDARRRSQFNISPLPNFPIFVKFCQRRPVCYLRHDLCHNLPYCQICNRVKFCELTNFELIGNFWRSWFWYNYNTNQRKKFLGWDPILFTLFLFNTNPTLNSTNHKQKFAFLSNFTAATFSHFSPKQFRFSPIRAFNVFFYVFFYIFFYVFF